MKFYNVTLLFEKPSSFQQTNPPLRVKKNHGGKKKQRGISYTPKTKKKLADYDTWFRRLLLLVSL